jgi:hypothetical protein
MKGRLVTSFASLLLISSLPLAPVLLAQNPRSSYPPQQQAKQTSSQASNQTDTRTFSGKITKSNGKYVLEDLASKTPFGLDDQKAAKKYDGKSVIVTGSLDTATNTIHIQKIEAAA